MTRWPRHQPPDAGDQRRPRRQRADLLIGGGGHCAFDKLDQLEPPITQFAPSRSGRFGNQLRLTEPAFRCLAGLNRTTRRRTASTRLTLPGIGVC
jgi:hypothetical protein